MAAQPAPAVARRERVLVGLASAYVLFRVTGFLEAEPRTFNDTSGYESTGDHSVLSVDFLAGSRAPTVPFLYMLVTGDDARIWAQLAISIASWLALAASVAASVQNRVMRRVSFAAVLLFALAPEVVIWDAALLSESVSVSLAAALVACWLQIARRPSAWAYALMLALAAAWTLARDPHAYVAAGLGLVVAATIPLFASMGGSRRMRGAVAAGLIVIAVASVVSANANFARWILPLQNVLSLRIADEPDQLAHFERAGMPATPDVLEAMRVHRETGEIVLEHPPAFDTPDALSGATPFHRWLRTDGRATYTEFLLTRPGVGAEGFAHLGETLLDPELVSYASDPSAWDAEPLAALVYPRRAVIAVLVPTIAVGLALFVGLRFGPRREWLVPAFLIASSLPFAILVHHGGALEPDRHGLLPSVFLRLGGLLLILFAVDRWLQRGERRLGASDPAMPARRC